MVKLFAQKTDTALAANDELSKTESGVTDFGLDVTAVPSTFSDQDNAKKKKKVMFLMILLTLGVLMVVGVVILGVVGDLDEDSVYIPAAANFPPAFPLTQWLGGDDVYSVPLLKATSTQSQKSLWLYGDTFWNNTVPGTRTFSGPDFPSSTVGTTTVDGSTGEVDFTYVKGAGTSPVGFLIAPPVIPAFPAEERDAVRIWPKDGVLIAPSAATSDGANLGTVWISALMITPNATTNFFDTIGVDFVTIDNVHADSDWQSLSQSWKPFMRSEKLYPATALWQWQEPDSGGKSVDGPMTLSPPPGTEKGYVYDLCCLNEHGSGANISFALIRHKIDATVVGGNLDKDVEYWGSGSNGDEWKVLPIDTENETYTVPDATIDNIVRLATNVSSEASIYYESTMTPPQWVITYSKKFILHVANQYATIQVRFADSITGPWSEPVDAYEYPETTVGNPQYIYNKENGTFCYAGKSHPEYTRLATTPIPVSINSRAAEAEVSSSGKQHTEILTTYCCNSLDFAQLLNNQSVYVPKTAWIAPQLLYDSL